MRSVVKMKGIKPEEFYDLLIASAMADIKNHTRKSPKQLNSGFSYLRQNKKKKETVVITKAEKNREYEITVKREKLDIVMNYQIEEIENGIIVTLQQTTRPDYRITIFQVLFANISARNMLKDMEVEILRLRKKKAKEKE